MDRLVTARADQISGADFFRSVFGQPPEDRAFKEARKAEWRRICAEERADFERVKAQGQLPGESAMDMLCRLAGAIDETDRRIKERLAAWEAEYQSGQLLQVAAE